MVSADQLGNSSEPKKPCNVCTDFRALRRKYGKESSGSNSNKNPDNTTSTGLRDALSPASSLTAQIVHDSSSVENEKSKPYEPFPCPPDSTELGSSTWTFLHTMAAYYPENPTSSDKASMSGFLSALGRFYPCWYCASHFQEYTKSHPPQLDSNATLSQWFCEVHNEVNERLGKPTFDCTKIFERWKDGSPNSKCFE